MGSFLRATCHRYFESLNILCLLNFFKIRVADWHSLENCTAKHIISQFCAVCSDRLLAGIKFRSGWLVYNMHTPPPDMAEALSGEVFVVLNFVRHAVATYLQALSFEADDLCTTCVHLPRHGRGLVWGGVVG